MIRIFDNHSHLHKDHKVKPALEMNQMANRPLPIVWISGTYSKTTWFGIWCRDPSLVQRLTQWIRKGILVNNWIKNNTRTGEVRGACNGGFFTPRGLSLIGHVGTGMGWQGNDIIQSNRLDRYAFGMVERGATFRFDVLPMDVTQRDNKFIHSLPKGIQNYPYGLSGIGLLVNQGNGRRRPNESPFRGRNSRTAIAWTNDRKHFFLIVARRSVWDDKLKCWQLLEGWTWDETVNFFTTELPRWMQNDLLNWIQKYRNRLVQAGVINRQEAPILFPDKSVSIQIDYAIMLDGGGSSQIAWGWKRSNRPPAYRQHTEYRPITDKKGRIIGWKRRLVPTFVEVKANAP